LSGIAVVGATDDPATAAAAVTTTGWVEFAMLTRLLRRTLRINVIATRR
jgi:hypothetical protein